MGGGADQQEAFRYTYPVGEKREGETQIYKHDVLSEDDPLTTLEYETVNTIKAGFL